MKADKAEMAGLRTAPLVLATPLGEQKTNVKAICKDISDHQGLVKASQPPEAGGFWMAASGHYFSASKHEQKRRGEFTIP